MSNSVSPEDSLKFQGSLRELVTLVRRRVVRASAIIRASDDPDVLDREMRFIRPFWEYIAARQKFNQSRFWDGLRGRLSGNVSRELVVKTPLLWLPARRVLVRALGAQDVRGRAELYNVLRGLDIAVFNFMTILGRMRHLLGIADAESFEISTTEPDDGGKYRFLRRVILRTSPDGGTYRVVTCRFQLPDGEELKIEKDYSQSLTDPFVAIRLQKDIRLRARGDRGLECRGSQSRLKRRDGQISLIAQ